MQLALQTLRTIIALGYQVSFSTSQISRETKNDFVLNTGREAVQRAACASNIEDNHCSGLSGDDDSNHDGDDDGYQVMILNI